MTVKDIQKNPETWSMRVIAEFEAGIDAVWQLWADPRKLERWWGPPAYPATVTDHDLAVGGRVNYYMTSPEGDKSHGWWRIIAVDPPHSLQLRDGFADDTGEPDPELPITEMRMELSANGSVTQMTLSSVFPTLEAMNQMIAMGMEDGIRQAMGQIDAILAE